MSKKKHNKIKNLGAMLGKVHPGCVVCGGKDVPIENWDELVAEHKRGMPVIPPRIILLGEQGLNEPSPAEVAFEELARSGRLRVFMTTFFDWPSADGLGNAHEVAQALMLDLILAQRSEGWRWIMADVGTRYGHRSHSWLEYKGWVVDGACGMVKILPAGYYRADADARNVVERNAAEAKSEWQKSASDLGQLIAEQEAASRARVLDPNTGVVTEMPAEELAPGMVLGHGSGVGAVWVDPASLRVDMPIRQPPFAHETQERIQRIREALLEVDPNTPEEWDHIFRSELRPEREIFIYECAVEAYRRIVGGHEFTLEQKRDYYRALMVATLSDQKNFVHAFKPRVISQYEAICAAEMFRRVFQEKDGLEKCKQWPAPNVYGGATGTAT